MDKNRKLSGLQELIPTNINKVEVHSRTVNSYFTTIGEEGVGSPEDHYEQLESLKHANQGELFVLTLSSCPGGQLFRTACLEKCFGRNSSTHCCNS